MGLQGGRRRTSSAAALVAVATVLVLAAGPGGAEGYRMYRLCGKHLADILEMICKGRGFHDPFANAEPGKRVVAYLQSGKGVSDECCRQGCTRRTMESYCSAEPINHKQPAPERPEPGGDLRHQHRTGIHPDSEGEAAAVRASASPEAAPESTSAPASGSGQEGREGRPGRRKKGERRRRRGGRRAAAAAGVEEGGGGSEERGRRGGKGASGRKCRCKRRRRKTDAEIAKRHLNHASFQIGTIAPSYLGIPVILPRAKVHPALS